MDLAVPHLSIIVPVFNAERYLRACLDSILAQETCNIELIAVDDGSTDGSATILDEYAQCHACLKLLRIENGGAAAARNAGLDAARGTHVWFIDADDEVAAGALLRLFAAACDGVDIVAFNGVRFAGSEDGRPFYALSKPAGPMSGQAWIITLCRQQEFHHLVYLHCYRRDFLLKHAVRFAEGIVHEDIGWVTETDLCAVQVIYLDEGLYRYRRNPHSVTGSDDDAKLLKRIDAYVQIVPQLRRIHSAHVMDSKLRRLLRAELVGQGIQIDRLARRLTSAAERKVRERCREARWWRTLWPDATTLKTKRQLWKIMLREWLS